MKSYRKRLCLVVALSLVLATDLLACPVCYGEESSAEVQGVKWAIVFLMGVTGTVLGGVVAFVLHMRKRAKMTLDGTVQPPSSN